MGDTLDSSQGPSSGVPVRRSLDRRSFVKGFAAAGAGLIAAKVMAETAEAEGENNGERTRGAVSITGSVYERLKALGIELPPIPEPAGNYVHAVRSGNLLFLAGKSFGKYTGKVGREVSLEQAYEYARSTGLIILSVIHHELGSLDRVTRIVKVLGLVNAVPDFPDHPKVINGCSDLFIEVFGERGRHARTSIGAGSAPNQTPLEIETVIEFSLG